MLGCCEKVDTRHIDAYAKCYYRTVIVESPGHSTTNKVLIVTIAFFGLGSLVVGVVLLGNGTLAGSGCYALIGAGGVILILDGGFVYWVCRAHRKAITDLNEHLRDNPNISVLGTEPCIGNGCSKVYNIQSFPHNILYFSKKRAEQVALEAAMERGEVRAQIPHGFLCTRAELTSDELKEPLYD